MSSPPAPSISFAIWYEFLVSVSLKTVCSRRWESPKIPGCSSLDPVATPIMNAALWLPGMFSTTTGTPPEVLDEVMVLPLISSGRIELLKKVSVLG